MQQVAALGCLQVRFTGGESLLRDDFVDVYMMLKRKGLLVSVFINATTIRAEHIALFKKNPPRDIEITVCTDGLMAMPRAMPKFARNT